jgi:hypothetical protein
MVIKARRARTAEGPFEEYLFCGGDGSSAIAFAQTRYVPPVPLELGKQAFATSVPEGTTAMIRMLVESLVVEVITPILRAQDHETCLTVLGSKWHSFFETLGTLHVLIARSSSEERACLLAERACESAKAEILQAARALAGQDGEDEAAFAVTTYGSALRLIGMFGTDPTAPQDRDRDRVLAQTFHEAAAFHVLGAILLTAAASSQPTPTAIALAFDLLRAGALRSYGAAREAYALRTPAGDDSSPDAVDDDEHEPDPLYTTESSPLSR